MLESKSCGLKGVQKVFYLNQNRVASCCRAEADVLNSENKFDFYLKKWQQESLQLDAGVELPGCSHCWRQEKNGKISYRSSIVPHKNQIELFLSNLCNQMCSYCSPTFSSTWQQSIEQEGMFQRISTTAKNNLLTKSNSEHIDYWIDQLSQYIDGCEDNSVYLKLLGGEPLMQYRNLQKFLFFNSKKIQQLVIHTNLNPPNNKFLKWLLYNIGSRKLLFTISIDSSPELNHWPRALFNKKKFVNNLNLLQQHQIPVKVASVISVLSVFDIKNFISWGNQQEIKINFFKLNNPDCLEAVLIPHPFRLEIWKTIEHLDPPEIIREILHQETNVDQLKLFEQRQYLVQYFERNHLDPAKYPNKIFQDYWSWLTENYKK